MEQQADPIIFDFGSLHTKLGFGGYEAPLITTPTDWSEFSNDGNSNATLRLYHPIEKGYVLHWDNMEALVKRSYGLLKSKSEAHPVLITETANNSNENRERMTQLLFEKFNVPLFCGTSQCLMSLFQAGKMTGLVVESGDGITQVVPINAGQTISQGIKTSTLAGNSITQFLDKLLNSKSCTPDIVRKIKENHLYVSPDYQKDLNTHKNMPDSYTLPDGNVLKLEAEMMFCAEALFEPKMINSELPGITELIAESIKDSTSSLSKDALLGMGNLMISGGNTSFKGFDRRLVSEIKKKVPGAPDIFIDPTQNRNLNAWIGGSVYSTLSVFPAMCITKAEYEESGASIIHQKCPL